MTDHKYEELSALLDDELDSARMQQVLDAMKEDYHLRESWDHYSLIGDVLRGEAVRHTSGGVASRVTAALANEPAIIAVPSRPDESKDVSYNPAKTIRWLRPVAGMALAASVAVMAIYVAPVMNQSPINQGGELADAETTPALTLPTGHRWKNLNKPGVATKLDQYLREHSEFSVPGGMGGVAPYASFVSYDDTRR